MTPVGSANRVVVVGAGLAGLCCARRLLEAEIPVLVLEAGPEVGGRVRTDLVAGHRLDHGFQVLQTAYPEAQAVLDYPGLQLRPFESGALIRTPRGFQKMLDPWRNPLGAVGTLFNGIGTLGDRLRLAGLRGRVLAQGYDPRQTPQPAPELSTRDFLLNRIGVSPEMYAQFLQPWFAGVFFERELATSSRFFEFVFHMFSAGPACIPAEGMGAIPRQLAGALPAESLRLRTRVTRVTATSVTLESGETLDARGVVLAVEGPAAARLAGGEIAAPASCGTTCLSYSAATPPLTDRLLVLNGTGVGPINNLCVPSNVSASYAPPGRALVSVSVIDPAYRGSAGAGASDTSANPELERAVRQQLTEWFGAEVAGWQHLQTRSIAHGLPAQPAGTFDAPRPHPRLESGVYCCGDYRESASIQGAMLSGRRAAEQLLSDLRQPAR
ncbi:MAG: NAD(P)/FAD-dependent oxidoreductase [Planctomycetaceae bacterium]